MKHGVMSQCVVKKNILRSSVSIHANLLHKLNTKLGGINSCLVSNEITSKYLVDHPVLVLGIDVTHPSLEEQRMGMPSIAAIVGNLDMMPQAYAANIKVSLTYTFSFLPSLGSTHWSRVCCVLG
jgi:hypothetical protein